MKLKCQVNMKGIRLGKEETKTVDGFYDGDGIYRVRFMPSFEGDYTFEIKGSFSDEVYTGAFHVTPAQEDNHGPVRVSYTYHMAYEDGKPYYSIGTTCYVWELQSEELQKQTLETLADSAFNKIHMKELRWTVQFLHLRISWNMLAVQRVITSITRDLM